MSEGLFDDLEALPHVEIDEKSKQLERDLRSLDDEFNSLKQERRAQVEIVKSLRPLSFILFLAFFSLLFFSFGEL